VRVEVRNLGEVKNEYTSFVDNFSSATPFHTYEWLSALENLGNKCEVAMFYENSDLVGVCPLFVKKVSLMKIYFSPIFGTETAYLGVLGSNLSGMLKELKKNMKNFFVIQPPALKIAGKDFEIENKDTIIANLDAKNSEEHLKRVRKGHRYDTRKAEKEGVSIKEDYSEKAIKQYYSLLKQTYEKSHYAPLPEKFYLDAIRNLRESGKLKLLLASYRGEVIGGAAFPYSNGVLYYWTGGSRKEKEFASLYPNNLIQWEIIKWGYEKGIGKYDMLGASIEGIKQFKLGWGGQLQGYQRIYSSKRLRLMASLYSKLGAGVKEKIRKSVRK